MARKNSKVEKSGMKERGTEGQAVEIGDPMLKLKDERGRRGLGEVDERMALWEDVDHERFEPLALDQFLRGELALLESVSTKEKRHRQVRKTSERIGENAPSQSALTLHDQTLQLLPPLD